MKTETLTRIGKFLDKTVRIFFILLIGVALGYFWAFKSLS